MLYDLRVFFDSLVLRDSELMYSTHRMIALMRFC